MTDTATGRKHGQHTEARIPLVGPDGLTPEQQRIYDMVLSGPRRRIQGPLRAALHRPEIAEPWHKLGEVLRYRTSFPLKLSELAILVTAERMKSGFEWYAHLNIALDAGLPAEIAEDIRNGRVPATDDAEILDIHRFCFELHSSRQVSDEAYDRVLRRWGMIGTVELTSLIGYYTMVAMTLNAHRFPLPDGSDVDAVFPPS